MGISTSGYQGLGVALRLVTDRIGHRTLAVAADGQRATGAAPHATRGSAPALGSIASGGCGRRFGGGPGAWTRATAATAWLEPAPPGPVFSEWRHPPGTLSMSDLAILRLLTTRKEIAKPMNCG